MQATRASRISEVEWNACRPKLEKLYLDDNVSRQEVIEIMAREHNFFATEKQLKYQFNKWGLKKYIKDRDLTAMLSLKRKRQELGRNTTFVYRGHLLEQERLERASKRRKGPPMSSPELPPYIRTLVSPRQSPPKIYSLQPHYQISTLPDSTKGAHHDNGRQSTLDFLSGDSFQLSGDPGLGDAANSLGVSSDSLSFQDGEQAQANGGSWEALLDAMTSLSPGPRLFIPTPYGRDIQDTGMKSISPLTQQISGISAYVSNPQSPHHDDFPSFDLNHDIDFSMYLNSPHRPSTASSSSRPGSNPRRSLDRISISPLQLTNHEDTYRGYGEFDLVSESTPAADQALDPVTKEDLEAELIVSLLVLLKSLAFPRFNTVSQKYEYDKSMLSDLFCADWCEWMVHEVEGLLDLYLEMCSRSIRKRRTARAQNSLPSKCNLNLNEPRQGFACSDGPERLSNPTDATVASKEPTTLFRWCSTPMGKIAFKVKQGASSLIGEERIHSNLITISFMPQAMERTPGICIRLSRMMGGPAICPRINTFNVVPDDSAIIQCVLKNDLRGIQTLFDLGAASARDVNSKGISLLSYAMLTGCSDVFRLLIQGGASTNECDDCNERITDIVTVVWNLFVEAHSGLIHMMGLSVEKLKSFEECVAITQLALDNNCAIDSADDRRLHAGPLFALVGTDRADIDASTLVDAVDYLLSIGWDLEERNCYGQTPLLYAAAACGPQVARCLRGLNEKGARLDARDEEGRGPLLSALCSPDSTSNWIDLTYIWDIEDGVTCDNNWDLSQLFRTEDRSHERDYYDTESTLDPLTPHISPHISRSTPSLNDIESSELVRDQQSKCTAEQPMSVDSAMSDLNSNASSWSEESVSNPEDDDYVYAFDDEGDGFWIRNPSHVLKDRVRIKLKILLEAGCDPNVQDNDGKSTDDYAWNGVWSQWLWALDKTGYVFDEEHDRWVKRIDSA